jgi:predicted enzyme related to lactoylglutathione lyase
MRDFSEKLPTWPILSRRIAFRVTRRPKREWEGEAPAEPQPQPYLAFVILSEAKNLARAIPNTRQTAGAQLKSPRPRRVLASASADRLQSPPQRVRPASHHNPTPREAAMIQGLGTAIYPVTDLAQAKAWYTQVLQVEPYFDQPFYVGYNVAGFELGLLPSDQAGSAGVTAYWRVPDAAAELNRLIDLGGTPHEKLQDVGEGIKVASVLDPFGNVFAILENPHFDLTKLR